MATGNPILNRPYEGKKKLSVCGPFSIETSQNFEPVSPTNLAELVSAEDEKSNSSEQRFYEQPKSASVKYGIRNELAVLIRFEPPISAYLHAEWCYNTPDGEKKIHFHIAPKFGTVSKLNVNEAIKECTASAAIKQAVHTRFWL